MAQIQPLTVAQITKYKAANPTDTTDYSTLITNLQTGLDTPCPACMGVGNISTGIDKNNPKDSCPVCGGMAKVTRETLTKWKQKTTWVPA